MTSKKNIIILWDFDGTLIDTMPCHAKLAADVISKYFKINKKIAKEKYLGITGLPFDKQLEIIFPEKIYKKKRLECAKEYHQRKIKEVYYKALPIKGAMGILRKLQNLGYKQFILTGTEKELVKKWLKKQKISKIEVFGKEKGIKAEHLKILRKKFPKEKFLIISDSFKDLVLPVEIKIGFYKDKKEKQKLSKAKPNFLISNLKGLEKIFSKI